MKGDDLVAPGVDVGCCRHRLERRSEPGDDPFDLNGDHLGDEVGLVDEEVVELTASDARGSADLVERGGLDALCAEKITRGVDDSAHGRPTAVRGGCRFDGRLLVPLADRCCTE